jgi:predicted RNA-binding protein YlqC (UPF0109 family)
MLHAPNIKTSPTMFRRHKDPSGTWKSICTRCFRSIAIADTELGLSQSEREHICKRPLSPATNMSPTSLPKFSKDSSALSEETLAALEGLRVSLAGLVKALVSEPEHLTVELHVEAGVAYLEITTSTRDLGMVIGKQGRTVGSLRVITHAISQHLTCRVELNVGASNSNSAS